MLEHVVRNYIKRNKEKIDKLGEEGKELFILICDLIKENNEEMELFVDNQIETTINA